MMADDGGAGGMGMSDPEEKILRELTESVAPLFESHERATALVLAESINDQLAELLRDHLVAPSAGDLLDGDKPLSTFSARIDVCHACGLISDEDRRQMHIIRRVRNEFAHFSMVKGREISFETESVRSRCFELTEKPAVVSGPLDWALPRDRFLGACYYFVLMLVFRSHDTTQLAAAAAMSDETFKLRLSRVREAWQEKEGRDGSTW
jgi:mannitol operon repressor